MDAADDVEPRFDRPLNPAGFKLGAVVPGEMNPALGHRDVVKIGHHPWLEHRTHPAGVGVVPPVVVDGDLEGAIDAAIE